MNISLLKIISTVGDTSCINHQNKFNFNNHIYIFIFKYFNLLVFNRGDMLKGYENMYLLPLAFIFLIGWLLENIK